MLIGQAHENVDTDFFFAPGKEDIGGIPDKKEYETDQYNGYGLYQNIDEFPVVLPQNFECIRINQILEIQEHKNGKGQGNNQRKIVFKAGFEIQKGQSGHTHEKSPPMEACMSMMRS